MKLNRRDFLKGGLAGLFTGLLAWLGAMKAEETQGEPTYHPVVFSDPFLYDVYGNWYLQLENGRLWRSKDKGATWEDVEEDDPIVPDYLVPDDPTLPIIGYKEPWQGVHFASMNDSGEIGLTEINDAESLQENSFGVLYSCNGMLKRERVSKAKAKLASRAETETHIEFSDDLIASPGDMMTWQSQPAKGRSFWVKEDGNDFTGDGSLMHPFGTIAHALEVAQNTGPITPDDFIYVLPGQEDDA